MPANKKKKPSKASREVAQGAEAHPGKHVPVRSLALPGASNSDKRLCWRFTHVDHEGPWGFSEVDTETFCGILRKLSDFESMTVAEVFHNGGYPGKEYDVATLPNREALARLVELNLADMTKIWRLQWTGESRLFGFLDGNIFHVVFWDPKHKIWPSKPRHT